MGFVATTLSICDPIGALQRLIIKSPLPKINEKGQRITVYNLPPGYHLNSLEILKTTILGRAIGLHFALAYILAIEYSPEGIIKEGESKKKRAKENLTGNLYGSKLRLFRISCLRVQLTG
jgi:hypothetical protein